MALGEDALKRLAFALDVTGAIAYIMSMTQPTVTTYKVGHAVQAPFDSATRSVREVIRKDSAGTTLAGWLQLRETAFQRAYHFIPAPDGGEALLDHAYRNMAEACRALKERIAV